MTAMTGNVQAVIPSQPTPPSGPPRTNLAWDPAATKISTPATIASKLGWAARGATNRTNSLLTGITGPAGTTLGTAFRITFTGTLVPNDSGWDISTFANPYAVTVGKTYTASGWFRSSRAGVDVQFKAFEMPAPNTAGTYAPAPAAVRSIANQWQRVTITWTATKPYVLPILTPITTTGFSWTTGDTIDGTGLLVEEAAAPPGTYFDGATPDVPMSATVEGIDYAWTGTAHASTSTATKLGKIGDIPLGRVQGTGTLDESWAPYVQADLTIALPDQTTLELLDPRALQRVRIDASTAFPGSLIPAKSRTFNLGLRARVVDQGQGEVQLSLSSDEALLMDDVWTGTTPNDDAAAHQNSLRAIIDNVILSRIGAHLEPGTVDAPFKVLTDATNLSPNGGFRTNLTGWISNGSSFTRVAGAPPGVDGTGFARITYASATLNGGILNNGGEQAGSTAVNVTAGQTYTTTLWVRASAATTVTLNIEWADSASNGLGSTTGTPVGIVANTWTKLSLTAVAPANAARAGTYSYRATGTSWPAGSTYDAAGHTFVLGSTAPDFFDGDTPDSTEYGFNWTGTPSASTSTRIALFDRGPELLSWNPGVSGWDFVQPLFQSVGFRLFCDEARRWYLVDGEGFIAPGMVQLTMPGNLHAATDTTDRDGESWFDAAVVRYRWRDPDGTQREQVDTYQRPGYTKVTTIDVDHVYPGPGFAKYAVDRTQGRGRTAELEALTDLTATPSESLQITLPSTPTLLGQVRQVLFDLNTGTMRISSRGLTDVPAHAIDLLTGTIDALPGTIDSL